MKGEKRKLPDGWNWAPLGGVHGCAEIVNGSTPSTDDPSFWNGNILWATPADIGNLRSVYLSDTKAKITKDGFESCSTKMLPAGTVLMTSRAPVGNVAIAASPMCTNQGFKSFVPREGIHSLYLYFALRAIVRAIQKQSHGNTFTEITKELVAPFRIPLPLTLDDQIAIAAELEQKLSKAESMRQAAQRQYEAVVALRAAAVQELFAGLKNAKSVPLKELIDLAIDGPHVTPTYVAEGVPFVTVLNIRDRRLDFTGAKFITKSDHREFSRRGKVEVGDILITKDGTLGTPCLVETEREFSFFVSVALIKPRRDRILSRYLFYALDSRVVQDRVTERSMGAGLKHLVLQEIKALQIPFVEDKGQQQEVASRLQRKIAAIDRLVSASRRQLDAVQALAGAILRETFDFSEN